jgi:hypothetical protein
MQMLRVCCVGFAVCLAACADAPAPIAISFASTESIEVAETGAAYDGVPIAMAVPTAIVVAKAAVASTVADPVAATVTATATATATDATSDSLSASPDDSLSASDSSDLLSLTSSSASTATSRSHPLTYGVSFDAGIPDGATAALVIRPRPAIRLDAGVSYNGISYGERGGITWAPFARASAHSLSPTVSLDVGHFGDGDANPLARLLTGNPMYSSPVLDRVGYDYADAHVGLELARSAFTLYLHAGVSRVTGAVHELGSVAGGQMPITFGSDPTVTLTMLSARVGVIFYFAK